MTKNSQDELARAYATLSSLRKNISQMTSYRGVEEKYINEFHSVLDRLADIGIDVSEFRIPDSEVTPRVVSSNIFTDEKTFSEEKYVDKAYFLTKMDAILGYFEIITSEKPRRIGFRTSQE
jgi:hypothetical protein